MASTYLSRTLSASPTNQKIVTYSFWAKRSNLGIYAYTLVGNTSAPYVTIGFDDTDRFSFQLQAGTGSVGLTSTSKYRDTSAWYHAVCVLDTTQATSSDRMKIYINGVQITDFDTANYPTQNSTWNINTNVEHGVGGSSVIQDFDGYMAQVYFIDGQALDASYFGVTDSTGIWKPKAYSGSYGTNGFYLKFSNGGNLGADSSGNGNDFTKSGNGVQRKDTPSNIFATWSNITDANSSNIIFSKANLKAQQNLDDNYRRVVSTIPFPKTGKWYYEVKADVTGTSGRWFIAGIGTYKSIMAISAGFPGSNADGNIGIGSRYDGTGYLIKNTVNVRTGNELRAYSGDIIRMAVDRDNNKIWIAYNANNWFATSSSNDASSDPATGAYESTTISTNTDEDWFLYVTMTSSSFTVSSNSGSSGFTVSSSNADGNGYGNFEYAPPTGYLALCTKNLASVATPTINTGSDYMNTVLYTGNGSTQSITGVGFQPDFVWLKKRSATAYHYLMDSTRGTGKQVYSNVTNAEETNANALTSYDSDGFSLGTETDVNANGTTYVGWNWLANGGTTSSNTDGSITSTVQANTTAGFSVVTWTGNATASATVGHGLGIKPNMIMIKNRTDAESWWVGHSGLGGSTPFASGYYLFLNSTNAVATNNTSFCNAEPTTTTFKVGGSTSADNLINGSGDNMLAYCFAEIKGYSKFGSYTGNGSADGPFIYTGFRPAWIMIKGTSSLGADQAYSTWSIWDIDRSTYNVTTLDQQLTANTLYAEGTRGNGGSGSGIVSFDILSNGFKIRNGSYEYNQGGYIFMTFAENPFVTSGGLPVTAR